MPQLRFVTARDLFEAFPTASDDIDTEPGDETSRQFLDKLVSEERLVDAVNFCAYLLPRREAVWWACQCVRALAAPQKPDEGHALAAAEAWVKEPEEEHRNNALQWGLHGKSAWPATWAALAAGWAGNTAVPGVPFPLYQTAKAARAAVLGAVGKADSSQQNDEMRNCIERGKKLLGSDSD